MNFRNSLLFIGIALISSLMLTSCGETSVKNTDFKDLDSVKIVQRIQEVKENISNTKYETRNAAIYENIADMAYENKDYSQASYYYMLAMKADPNIESKKTIVHTLIEISGTQMGNKAVADMFKLAFVEAYPNEPQAEDYKKSLSAVNSLGNLLTIFKSNQAKSEGGVSDPVTGQIVDGSEIYATVLSEKKDAAEKIIEAIMNLMYRNPKRSVDFIDWLTTKYPDAEEAGNAAFLRAFVYENMLQDTVSAKAYYRKFIADHPDHEFAEQAQMLLDNIGKEAFPFEN